MGILHRSQGTDQPAGASSADEDSAFLLAKPISRKRMDLLWLDPPRLAQVEEALGQDPVITITLGDSSEMRDHDVTPEDVAWAKRVEKIVDVAFAAVECGDNQRSISEYEKALDLAPGCDLFLMSIGVGYAYLGQKERALRYLERAAAISPGNSRIRTNLAEVRRL